MTLAIPIADDRNHSIALFIPFFLLLLLQKNYILF